MSSPKMKLCCLINGKSHGGLLTRLCDCGRKVCDSCVDEILVSRDTPALSVFWPKTPLTLLADHHYMYSRECSCVKYYIKSYGVPNEAQSDIRNASTS